MSTENQREFNEGEVILREGYPVPYAYLIQKGRVRVYRNVNNRQVTLSHLGPGQLFGEMGILTGQAASASVAADAFTVTMQISAAMVKALLLKSPEPVRKMMTALMERLRQTNALIRDQHTGNLFFSICQILQLLEQSQRQDAGARPDPRRPRGQEPAGLQYGEVVRTAKSILVVSQVEVDIILEKLVKLGLVTIKELRKGRYKKNVFDEVDKVAEYVDDRLVQILDPESFLQAARHVSQELLRDELWTRTLQMEFVDMQDFSELVQAEPDTIYKKIAAQEIPENLFFFHKSACLEWAKEMGEDFFRKTKRRRLDLDELSTVDDVVHVDDESLRQAFTALGFHKLTVLYASAREKGRNKIVSNVSRKIGAVIEEESQHLELDEGILADIEKELYDIIKKIKGGISEGSA